MIVSYNSNPLFVPITSLCAIDSEEVGYILSKSYSSIKDSFENNLTVYLDSFFKVEEFKISLNLINTRSPLLTASTVLLKSIV